MDAEHLEVSRSGRARCKLCKELIVKDTLRLGVTMPGASFDGDMVFWHHAICAAHRRPTGLLRALEGSGAKAVSVPARSVLRAVAALTQARRVKALLWRHPTKQRCIIEVAAGEYALFTDVGAKLLSVQGDLDTVLASVPDEDFAAAVAAAKNPTAKPTTPAKPSPRQPATQKAPLKKKAKKAASPKKRRPR